MKLHERPFLYSHSLANSPTYISVLVTFLHCNFFFQVIHKHIASVLAFVLICNFKSVSEVSIILSGTAGVGLFVTVLMFVAVFIVNLLLWKKGIHPVYDEGVEERVRIYKEVKAGRINIDDLPQPVVETAATRKIDEAIAKEEAELFEGLGIGGRRDG